MHNKADRLKNAKVILPSDIDIEKRDRLPAGQTFTGKFPILHEGEVPKYDLNDWRLTIGGEVEEEISFSFDEILMLPSTRIQCDIHCVTRWSKLDTEWEGVLFSDLLPLLKVKPEAKFVMFHADPDYETNVPLADLMLDNVMLAYRYAGEPLTEKHGWPLRTIVPHRYFWKSAKWVKRIEFMKEDRPGFWERNGFHNEADPFKEQRFSGEALPIPEDEWTKKEFD
ncbi:sulfite oxidase-like oxidoreductase [Cohnella luojiensis]|uniref:Sulfite oxidase-like oxidoreductase n=1 Tax=Cohnella luojiensis TaxID=652876 RepID=A0A4Y8M8A4_9BACL|nr:sulfite oxidase-like oxidoreductase [Cohnella luojiensis]TFE29988.1 sulfite oxidase-like oxidoreductase [Cohnella luojiensis]